MHKEDKLKIVEKLYWENKSHREIAEKIEMGRTSVRRYIKELKFLPNSRDPNRVNKNYFNKIDTEDKAYFLGLLYADGNVNANRTQITLQDRDEHILKDFQKYSGHSKNLQRKISHEKEKQNYLCFAVTSEKWSLDLTKLGCIPCKSLILKFPTKEQVPDHLIHHFIRGYFDGDGSVTYSAIKGRNHYAVKATIVGCEDFLIKVQELFESQDISPKIYKIGKKTNPVIRALTFSGFEKIYSFYSYLYKDATIYLDRKKNKFEYILSVLPIKNKDRFGNVK